MFFFILKYREFLFAKKECLPVLLPVCIILLLLQPALLYFLLPLTPPSLPSMLSVPDHDGGRPIEVNACILITHMVYL
jgi:hypothetical protein